MNTNLNSMLATMLASLYATGTVARGVQLNDPAAASAARALHGNLGDALPAG